MVQLSDLRAIIESIYLEEPLSENLSVSKIFINPTKITYLTGKVIIINEFNYPESSIDILIKNGCKVISRVWYDRKDVLFQPYILRVCFNIMWNGDEIFEKGYHLDDLTERCNYNPEDHKLFFPKVSEGIKTGTKGELDWLGWASQQVGINVVLDTPFIDLDFIKLKKKKF